MTRLVLASVLACVSTGCPAGEAEHRVELHGITKAPPASTGNVITNVTDEIYRIDLTQGVAIAVRCWESCEPSYGACANPTLVAENAALLGVRSVYRLGGGESEFALVAKQPGTTTLEVSSLCGVQHYQVHVLPR